MPFVQAKCPECGGILAVDNDQKAAICQFCGKPYIVEEAVNNYITYNVTNNTTNNVTNQNFGDGAVVNVYENVSKDFVIEGGVLKKYQGESLTPVIPEGVVAIESGVFKDSMITKVTLPSTLKEFRVEILSVLPNSIGPFYGCNYLKEIVFPEGVEEISRFAFSKCEGLVSVIIPDSVKHIGNYAFKDCTRLESVTIPNSVKSIGESAFKGCQALNSVTIPNSVRSIGESAFEDCKALNSVTIPNSVTSIGKNAFYGCENLTSVTIPITVDRKMFEYTPWYRNEIAKQEAEKQRVIEFRKSNGLCQYCGGEFKGLFGKKCSKCGKPKDY